MYKVLTYNAPHRKTQDLLVRLKSRGYNDVEVIATPWVKRKNFKQKLPHRFLEPIDIMPEDFSFNLGYKFISCQNIKDVLKNERDIILIGGSGVLAKDIIKNFTIINSHPAYLPYIRGLDSLKWAIYYKKPIGVTTHIISDQVDAGKLIRREIVPILPWDTFHSLAIRQYEMEIKLLASSIEDLKKSNLMELSINESKAMRRMPNSMESKILHIFDKMKKSGDYKK